MRNKVLGLFGVAAVMLSLCVSNSTNVNRDLNLASLFRTNAAQAETAVQFCIQGDMALCTPKDDNTGFGCESSSDETDCSGTYWKYI
jgi:hypothetical protein